VVLVYCMNSVLSAETFGRRKSPYATVLRDQNRRMWKWQKWKRHSTGHQRLRSARGVELFAFLSFDFLFGFVRMVLLFIVISR